MGIDGKPRVVLSGINLVDMGPLAVFKEALASLAELHGDRYDIIALVHKKAIFDIQKITYIEFPAVKSSWLKRLRFEYVDCKRLSRELQPELWLSMHDMTPNVTAKLQAVYCHNACMFYKFKLGDALMDWKFAAFTLLYQFLYRINITKNRFVIVQQNWMREAFRSRYGLENVVVAHPEVRRFSIPCDLMRRQLNGKYLFFYPAFPRVFKNFEVIFEAARLLEQNGFLNFEVCLTTDGAMNKYARKIADKYAGVVSINCVGPLSRDEVFKMYAKADCLLFPSKLETWGMPITEFKTTGKPILAADLPYAHETIGNYDKVAFFDPTDANGLAKLMKNAALGLPIFGRSDAANIAPLFTNDWEELWEILLHSKNGNE